MQPKLIAFDIESTGLAYWEPDFRVLSAAFAWFREDGSIGTRYLEGEDEIGEQIALIRDSGIRLVAHNFGFDGACLVHSFNQPWYEGDIDTMRLVQCYDNGGSKAKLQGPMSLEDEMAMLDGTLKVSSGLGLEASVSRILPKEFHNHKEPYYKFLRESGIKKGQEGANLQLLPPDMLEAYNTMDAIVTLLLHKEITDKFAAEGFDWTFDHKLHFDAIKRIVAAKATGIKVNVPVLIGNESKLEHDINCTKVDFQSTYCQPISEIEYDRYSAWCSQPKTDRGKQARASQPVPKALYFNPGSTQQLAELFIDKLGHKPVFFTKEAKARKDKPDRTPFVPKPSMRAAHLPSYGEGGEMLQTVKKRQLVAMQMAKLLDLSSKDGRFHHSINPCGTKTGRYTSSGGLNIQALARRDKGLMSCLISDEGKTFVSMDLAAGEPSVIAHYSQDPLYCAATFGMAGKKPYYDGDILMIDSPYMMFGSVTPIGKYEVRKLWDEGKFEGWENFTDHERKAVWKGLGIHKTIFLAKVYGQGAKGTINFVSDFGYNLDMPTSKVMHHQFWFDLFPRVRMLGERLEYQFEQQGYLYNSFGYRMVPERPQLALNYTIQSTVSGIMKVYETMLLELAPYAQYIMTVHDESIFQVPDEKLDDFKAASETATRKLNEYLGWSVDIRTGFQPGKELYSAK